VSAPWLALLDGRPVSAGEVADVDPRTRDPVPFGLYETVLVLRDRALLAGAHARRLVDSAADLDLGTLRVEEVAARLHEAARAARGQRGRLRWLRWKEGPGIRDLVLLDPEPAPPERISVTLAPPAPIARAGDRRHKRIDLLRDMTRAREDAVAAGHFDVVFRDERGVLLEGTRTSLFWRRGRTLHTPAARLPILPGVRRAWLMQTATRAGLTVIETEAGAEDLLVADEVLVTNAIQRVRRFVALET
jgi:4-amino-4-deoxychorismate lyase